MKHISLRTAAVVFSLSIVPTAFGAYGVDSQSVQDPLMEQSTNRMDSGSDQIIDGSKVTIQYVATAPCSTVTDYGNISEFIQGRHEIFPVLEREVIGMKPGEEKKVELNARERFGPHDDGTKMTVPKTLLLLGANAEDVLRNDAGELATVAEVGDVMAELDYNHPLTGNPTVVQIKILKVENP